MPFAEPCKPNDTLGASYPAVPLRPTAPTSESAHGAGTGASTVSATLLVWLRLAVTPVTHKLYVPAGVDVPMMMFKVETPEPLSETGVRGEEAPVGSPGTGRVTMS